MESRDMGAFTGKILSAMRSEFGCHAENKLKDLAMSKNHRWVPPDDHVIVLFGATGDLAKRKLLPGLFHLHAAGLLPRGYRIIGSAPKSFAMTEEQFRAHARDAVTEFGITKPDDPSWPDFEQRLSFGIAEPGDAADLQAAIQRAEKEIGGSPGRLFHLAVPPAAFTSMVGTLGDCRLAEGATRLIIEKPFGTDLASARELDKALHAVFDESQVFRIDHFLGKESVDNILAFRFANGLFEPVWNREHICYVQIDVPETLSIEGRAAFYDATGAYRDMIVTHLFQVLGFVAMEPPVSLSDKPLRDEKAKVFHALKPLDVRHVVRGQYEGYRSEPGVAPDSQTETMVAVKAEVDNWRWHGAVLPALGQGHGRQPAGGDTGLPPAAAADVPGRRRRAGRPGQQDRHQLRRPGLDHHRVPGQGPRPRTGPWPRQDDVHVRELVLLGACAGRLRAPHPARHDRRPVAVHQVRRDRAAVGDLHAAAGQPPAGRALRTRVVGPGGSRQADRAVPVAPA
jgi:Glucose-6-phosphate dehydrogenase, C-terminal domain/Glucose-6-phosphate dehydrogenase, NAD binding domain